MDLEEVYKKTKAIDSEEDWKVVCLKDIGRFFKGAGISRAQSNSGSIPAIRYGELYTCQHNYIKEP